MNIYAEEYNMALKDSLRDAEELDFHLSGATVESESSFDRESRLGGILYQVAKLIASRTGRKAERDLFQVEIGGFDTHSDAYEQLELKFAEINDALSDFVAEMKLQGVWDNVTIFTSSDFGRTLSSNGAGTDHAWAGQHWIAGGSIRGGQVLNKYPEQLVNSPWDVSRGRLIPEYPWESFMVPAATWMGVEDADRHKAFPNLGNFNETMIIPYYELFVNPIPDGSDQKGTAVPTPAPTTP